VDLTTKSRKEIGVLGERVAEAYLKKHGFEILERNLVKKLGELDIIVQKGETLHFIEVKTILCDELPVPRAADDRYDPSLNLHEAKVRKVARMGEWYVAEHEWEGEWQVDAVLVWLRRHDGMAQVSYLPQIV
jgi:putative endonuclease